MGLRVKDRNGEIFQFVKKIDFHLGGLFEEEWELTPLNHSGSWGGKTTDHILDMPADLSAMTVSFPKEIPLGKFYLLNVEAEVQQEENVLDVTRPLCAFDDSAYFRRVGTGRLLVENGALKCEDIAGWCGIIERKFEINRYEKPPVRFSVDVELLDNSADSGKTDLKTAVSQKNDSKTAGKKSHTEKPTQIKIFPGFVYADKAARAIDQKSFLFPERSVQTGRQTISWTAGDLFKDAKYPVRISTLNLVNHQKNKPIQAIIHGIYLTEEKTLSDAIGFDIETGSKVHVLRKNAEDRLRFLFKNPTREEADLLLKFTYENSFGRKTTEEQILKISAGQTETINPEWRPDTFGYWKISVAIRNQKTPNSRSVKTRSIAYFDPAGPTKGRAPGFLFSVCTHTPRWSTEDRLLEIEAAALCGVKVSRTCNGWLDIQPKPDQWNWKTTDFLVDEYEKKGIELQFDLTGTPSWALAPDAIVPKDGSYWKAFPKLDACKNFIKELCARYHGRIRYYENRNEPDLTGFSSMTLDQYAALQKAVYEAFTQYDKEAIVMTGGFATLNRRHASLIYPDFQRDFLAKANGYFHLHAFHAHGWFASYVEQIDNQLIPIRKETGVTVPWYSNETAMTSIGGLEQQQAEVLFKKLIFAWSRGAMGYTWYDLRNDGYDPAYGEHHFGMMTNDFYPKPVYAAYNALASYYTKMKYEKTLDISKNVYLFLFRNDKTILVPGWYETNVGETKSYLLETNAKKAFLVDLMGNEKEIPLQNKRVLFEIKSLPQSLKLTEASSVTVLGEILSVRENREAVPGGQWFLDLTAMNPQSKDSELELSLNDLPQGLTFVRSDTVSDEKIRTNANAPIYRKTIVGNESQKIRLEFKISKDLQESKTIPLVYRWKDSTQTGILYVPVRPAKWIPRPSKERSFDFILDQQSQIYPLTIADPAVAHRLWKGPDDLSVRVLLSFDENGSANKADWNNSRLTFKIEVIDDLYKAPASTEKEDQGDSVQLFLATEDGYRIWKKTVTACQGTNPRVYQFSVPVREIGLSKQNWREGVRFNLIVNDNDGEGPDSQIHLTTKLPVDNNVRDWPLILFENVSKPQP